MAKWQRIEDSSEKKRREVAPNENKWVKIRDDETYAYSRSVIFSNFATCQSISLEELLDWNDNVIDRKGDLRLQELMDFTVSVESRFDEFVDRQSITKEAAPLLRRLLESLTGMPVTEEEVLDEVNIEVGGNWRGFQKGIKYQRLN